MSRNLKQNLLKLTALCCFLLLFSQCEDIKIEESDKLGTIADSTMVVSARQEASSIGSSILKMGGNAFDAMIATDLALTVSYPVAGNIGGGGFMVFRDHKGEKGSIDFREKAPIEAHRDMYLDENGDIIPNKSRLGALAIGVPGTIAGLFKIHEKYLCKVSFLHSFKCCVHNKVIKLFVLHQRIYTKLPIIFLAVRPALLLRHPQRV